MSKSKDIRSFFTVISKKSGPDSKPTTSPAPSSSKKKPKRIVDSEDEDVVEATPEPIQKKKKPEKRHKREILSSDSEEDKPKASKTSADEMKLKPVNISDVFKPSPIKQSKVEIVEKPKVEEKTISKKLKNKKKKGTELGIHDDRAFEKTLLALDEDDDLFEKTLELLDQAEMEAQLNSSDEKKENKPDVNKTEEPKTSERKRSRTDSAERGTPKKQKMEHTDSGIDPGQEAHEKRRYSAMLYQKYLNRSGPKHHGMKEVPEGKPDCLKNLCFLRTGVLDSLESEEFDQLIKKHGGRVVHGVSKKVNYVVAGEDPGPAKLEKARNYNIPTISEDELFDLILVKSGMEAKYVKKDSSDGEDMGIVADAQAKTPPKEETEDTKEKKASPKKSREGSSSKQPDEKKKKTPQKEEKKLSKKLPETSTREEKVSVKAVIDSNSLCLSEKYRPKDLKGVIGQQGEKSNLNKLKWWLQNWHRNQEPEVRKKIPRPSPWSQSDNGAYFKCALLSGPPGVGKTTTATLVAQELGLDIVEFNASDTRSKKLLHEEVGQLLCTNTIAGFASGKSGVGKNRVLLMDEVDGMAGNEDRGGMQELIQLIKKSSVPIVCMCNDRNHPKIRSLVNYCFDLKFSKPRLEQIRGAMMTVCFKEGIKIQPSALSEIIAGTNCDVRQTLNHLAILASSDKTITQEKAAEDGKSARKDTTMGPWEVVRTVFTNSEHKDMSVVDKERLFFYDYSIGPLFVQENYLKVQPKDASNNKMRLLKAAKAADSISMGDVIDVKIRKNNNWSLLNSQAMFASVFPGHLLSGQFSGQINFPSWLGKNSKKNKFNRLAGEIQTHTRLSTSASKLAIKLDYLPYLKDAIVSPLQNKGMDGVQEAVDVMNDYNLSREDFDSILELSQWHSNGKSAPNIETKVKTAFTRNYNKQVTQLPYSQATAIAKKKASAQDDELLLGDEEMVASDNEDDDDISNNAMIKVKKPSTAKAKKDEASTSKKTSEGKGKGRGKKK